MWKDPKHVKDDAPAEAGTDEGRPISNRLLGMCSTHRLPLNVPTDCSRCHGEGEIEDDQDFGMLPQFVKCWQCGGSGRGLPDCEMCLIEDDDA